MTTTSEQSVTIFKIPQIRVTDMSDDFQITTRGVLPKTGSTKGATGLSCTRLTISNMSD